MLLNPTMSKIKYVVLIVYISSLLLLGIRPKIKHFHSEFLSESDIGGWCMYQRYVSMEGSLKVIFGDSIKELEWKKYLNHGGFASSAHPNVSGAAMQSFVHFLGQNHPEIKKISKNMKHGNSLDIIFKIVKMIEERDSVIYQVSEKVIR